jgi:hypothetical protein
MEAPIGFIRLNDAVALLTSARTERDDAMKMLADACEAGKVVAAYRTITGADELDRSVWRSPAWRNYFDCGEIEMILPLLDYNGRPNLNGYTARCLREIFIRRDSLSALLAEIPVSVSDALHRPARGPKAEKLERVVDAMRLKLQERKISADALARQIEKDLAAEYGVSRDTARKARQRVLAGTVSKPSEKLSANDK